MIRGHPLRHYPLSSVVTIRTTSFTCTIYEFCRHRVLQELRTIHTKKNALYISKHLSSLSVRGGGNTVLCEVLTEFNLTLKRSELQWLSHAIPVLTSHKTGNVRSMHYVTPTRVRAATAEVEEQ